MKVNLNGLKKIIELLTPGLSGIKETSSQSNHFVFKDGFAYTYNDEISVKVPFISDNLFTGAMPAPKFISLINKFKKDEIDIEATEEEVLIKCGRSRAGIHFEAEIHMPLDEMSYPKRRDWNELPENFLKALKDVLFSCSRDSSMPILTAVHAKETFLESCDSERATRWILKTPFKKSFLLPYIPGKALVKYDSVTRYAIVDNWVHFDIRNNGIFSCRTFDGEYPELKEHFNIKGIEFEFPSLSKEILEKASIFSEETLEQDRLIDISIDEKGILKIRSEVDTDWYEESTRIKDYKGEKFAFSINPVYLQQILYSYQKAVISEEAIEFLTDNYQHVVATIQEIEK